MGCLNHATLSSFSFVLHFCGMDADVMNADGLDVEKVSAEWLGVDMKNKLHTMKFMICTSTFITYSIKKNMFT